MADSRSLLWIDGVGAFLLCTSDCVSIGRTIVDGEAADVTLMANLSRRHATVVRSGEGYLLEAHSAARVDGREVQERRHLSDGSQIELGRGVCLQFRLPNVLSRTARIDFASGHRPERSIDGVLLMEQACVLGPGRDKHVPCPDWPASVLIFRRGRELWCKSGTDLLIGDRIVDGETVLHPGDVVSGLDLRFRIESLAS